MWHRINFQQHKKSKALTIHCQSSSGTHEILINRFDLLIQYFSIFFCFCFRKQMIINWRTTPLWWFRQIHHQQKQNEVLIVANVFDFHRHLSSHSLISFVIISSNYIETDLIEIITFGFRSLMFREIHWVCVHDLEKFTIARSKRKSLNGNQMKIRQTIFQFWKIDLNGIISI